jgi:hypothetical protein
MSSVGIHEVDARMQNSAANYGYEFEAFQLQLRIVANSGNGDGCSSVNFQVGS